MSARCKAIMAGGCFWSMQELIHELPGVVSSRVGYTGGDTPNATYRNTARTPKPSRSSTTPPARTTAHCWSSLRNPQSDNEEQARQRHGTQLPVRHLLP